MLLTIEINTTARAVYSKFTGAINESEVHAVVQHLTQRPEYAQNYNCQPHPYRAHGHATPSIRSGSESNSTSTNMGEVIKQEVAFKQNRVKMF
jgi:hypothetical protein